jgi:hypothetical protein
MEAVSIREFARRERCSDTLVHRALKSGKLTKNADGTLDAALVGSGWRKGNRRAANEAAKSPHTDPLVDIDSDASGDFVGDVLDGRFRLTGDAEQVKENALAAKHLLAARKEAGNLVDIEEAQAVLFEESRAARDAWIGFPTRIGPLLAADLGVEADRVVEALTAHVQQQLEQLGEPQGAFVR